MGTKIKFNVEIINDDGNVIVEQLTADGEIPSLEDFQNGENFRTNFDKLERTILKARKELSETIVKEYLEEVSKKKINESAVEGEKKIEENGYSIEAEIGRINIDTHKIIKGSRTVYDTRRDVFPRKLPLENYRSMCLNELILFLPCDSSYRTSSKILNRVRWQEEEQLNHQTIANTIEREGNSIRKHIEDKTQEILGRNGFNSKGIVTDEFKQNYEYPKANHIEEENIYKTIDNYNEGKHKDLQIELSEIHETFEKPEVPVNISIDDVGAKKQKESGRSKYSKHKQKGTREYVKNTVLHVQKGMGSYIINGSSIFESLKWLMAFLLSNNLINETLLVFFVDGADDLKVGIDKLFGWIPYKMILDWYHLKKKCEQRLSLTIKGSINRNMVLEELTSYLWVGKVEQAIEYLKGLNKNMLKNEEEIKRLISYFDRNWSFIPCYALRKVLGLRVSSNIGEKSNDLVVADRQKNNGMSWSKSGSVNLATVTTMHVNNQQNNWNKNRQIDFEFVETKKAA
jgi:hypothetical protein